MFDGARPPAEGGLRRGGAGSPWAALHRVAAAMVDPGAPGGVVQLGPLDGLLTEALIARGVAPARLVLVEADPARCRALRRRFPRARVVEAAAAGVAVLMRAALGRKEPPAAAVVGGLSLLALPRGERRALVAECLRLAAPGAPFVMAHSRLPLLPPLSRRSGPAAALGPDLLVSASPVAWVAGLWPARVWAYRLAAPPLRTPDADSRTGAGVPTAGACGPPVDVERASRASHGGPESGSRTGASSPAGRGTGSGVDSGEPSAPERRWGANAQRVSGASV